MKLSVYIRKENDTDDSTEVVIEEAQTQDGLCNYLRIDPEDGQPIILYIEDGLFVVEGMDVDERSFKHVVGHC